MRSAAPPRGGSSNIVPRGTSRPLAQSPDSVQRSSGSNDLATPADRVAARWLPFPPTPPAPPEHGRTSPPLRDGLIAFPGTLRSRYPPKLFAETRGENLLP